MSRVSFRQRKLNRIFGRIFRRRRHAHLDTHVFRPTDRIKNLLTFRQKIYLVLAVVAIGGLIGFVSFSGFFNIQKVSIARSSLDLPLDDIELSIRELAFGKNIFSVDKNLLAEAVKAVQPDISRVDISKNYPREIVVEVFKYPIVAEIKTNSESIFVNENGFRVVGDAPDRDTLTLTLGEFVDLEDPEIRVIDPAHLKFIREAIFYFESLTNMQILTTKYFPISREAHFKTEKNFDVWLDFASDYKTQIDKMIAAADILKIGEQKYEYIDLRVRGKIFFKKR